MKKHIGRICGSAVLALGLIVVPAIGANADASSSYSNAGILRATASYKTSTNILSVTDKYSDGWGARVQYDLVNPNNSGHYLDATGGANTTASRTISDLYQSIMFRACSINNGVVINCAAAYSVSSV